MQSLSSALPPFLLMRGVADRWPDKKVKVIDACSAPGNKTLQLAEALGERGRVFAFEKDERRYQLLKRTLKKYAPTCIRPTCGDFLQAEPVGKLKSVKFILLDPSCSGSGMLTNFTRDASQLGEGTKATQ
jgi:putative methyltransferase